MDDHMRLCAEFHVDILMRLLLLICAGFLNLSLLPAHAAELRLQENEVTHGRLPERLLSEQVTVSPDGRRTAYVAQRGTRVVAVINGQEAKPYDWIVRGFVGFTSDSKHVIYQVRRGPKMLTVIDGVEAKEYDSVDNWVCSPAGSRVGYVAKRGPKYLAVIDGVEGKEYDNVRIAALSPSGRTAIIAEIAGKDCLVVDGVDGRLYQRIVDAKISPDGKRLAFRAQRNENSAFMVIDGLPGNAYPAVEPAEFSLDSSRVGYAAGLETARTLVVDAAEITPPTGKFSQGPVFSPDAKRLAYVVSKEGDTAAVVLDQTPGKPYDSVTQLRFSPDGKRLAYAAAKSTRIMLVIDGVEIGHYEAISPDSIAFSPDAKHVAYVASRAGKEFVVIDGIESKPYDRILVGDGLRFDSASTIHTIAVTGRDLFALQLSPNSR